MNMNEADRWLDEAGKLGGHGAEFQCLQDVMTALLIRDRCVGEVNLSMLYRWYRDRLIALREGVQKIVNEIPYRIEKTPHVPKVLAMRIRAALETFPENMVQRPPEAA